MHWDVIVIGAGAAGLLAAARSAERGRRTLLIEKNRKPGVKILMSGGTRCNLTHNTDRRGIVEAFGPQGKFLHSALARLSPQDIVALFEAEGVATKVEATGKIFPCSNKATDVLAALLRRLNLSGGQLVLEQPIRNLERKDNGYQLITPTQTYFADKVILTTGGQSYPGCGTTGDGYRWAEQLGHTILPPRPSLVPITVNAPWVASLQGVTLPDVAVKVMEADKPLAHRRGSFLFAHFGLSGPVVLDVSRAVSGHPHPEQLSLECDFLPAMPETALANWLQTESSANGKKQLAGILADHLPRRLAEAVLQLSGLPIDRKAAALSKADRLKLATNIKRAPIPITGTLGFRKAEVTAGGIRLTDVDSSTMQSKCAPNLYLAGEILDLDGPIGGFNFQAAFSTGWLAGESV